MALIYPYARIDVDRPFTPGGGKEFYLAGTVYADTFQIKDAQP
jgi:hypothetical protein